jgi:hypothetical protein
MQNRLDLNWWDELQFYIFYSADSSLENIKIIDELYNHLSDILNSIMEDLYHFSDTVKYGWYYDYWKTQQFNKMDDILKEEINKYDLKRYLNSPIELPYNKDKIREKLLKYCQVYICDYFNERDAMEWMSKLRIV